MRATCCHRSFIESQPFVAVRGFYEQAFSHASAILPHSPTPSLCDAARNHYFTLLQTPTTDTYKLMLTAALDFATIIAVLWDRHCSPLYRIPHNPQRCLTIIYAAQQIRLSTSAIGAHDPQPPKVFEDPVESLKTTFTAALSVLSSDLTSLHQLQASLSLVADFMNCLGFLSWSLRSSLSCP
jgi:hypothetical protein